MKAKGRTPMIVAAVVVLIGSAILWWDLAREGFTIDGFLVPALFSVLGVFWLVMGFRTDREEDGEQPGETDS